MIGALLPLPPNRVWRTYPGGKLLDVLADTAAPADGHFPEDWIGSVTRATNIGREHIAEGVSRVPWMGEPRPLDGLIDEHPAYFLGAAHLARYGRRTMLLVKYLDAALRLHFQVHPTAQFAQVRMGQPSGKAEAYYVLARRPEVRSPALYLGWQRPPDRAALRRIIAEQDIAAMEAWFDPVEPQPGDCFFIPGGVPHAIGAGLLLVEVMEPSDLAVRFEFARGNLVLPEAARFMQRDLDFCLDVFDLTGRPRTGPGPHQPLPPRAIDQQRGGVREELIGPRVTPCFRVQRLRLWGDDFTLVPEAFTLALITAGQVHWQTASGATGTATTFSKWLCPAEVGPIRWSPPRGTEAEVLLCLPPVAA